MRSLLFAVVLLVAATAPPSVNIVRPDGIIAISVNGVPGQMRIEPGGTAIPLLSAGYAARAGLKGSMFGISYAVGPEVIDGSTAVARLGWSGFAGKRRVAWADRPHASGMDALIGPGGLPDPVVRFRLGPSLPGERTAEFPMIARGGLAGRWGELWAIVPVGGQPMRVRFDPHRPRTLATAGAAMRIAAAHRGELTGATERQEIAFGVARPVRTMTLGVPLAVGPLAIASLGVRTADFGNAAGIRQEGDPDEVVVIGGKAKSERDRLSLGADQLARCSSIVFDKPRKVISLTCA